MSEVTVVYHQEGHSWWADSVDVEGLIVSGNSLREVRDLVYDGLAFYLDGEAYEIFEVTAAGGPVVISMISDSGVLTHQTSTTNPARTQSLNAHGPLVHVPVSA